METAAIVIAAVLPVDRAGEAWRWCHVDEVLG